MNVKLGHPLVSSTTAHSRLLGGRRLGAASPGDMLVRVVLLIGRDENLHAERLPMEHEAPKIGTDEDANNDVAVIIHGKTSQH
jgi:hypothetical protein